MLWEVEDQPPNLPISNLPEISEDATWGHTHALLWECKFWVLPFDKVKQSKQAVVFPHSRLSPPW